MILLHRVGTNWLAASVGGQHERGADVEYAARYEHLSYRVKDDVKYGNSFRQLSEVAHTDMDVLNC